MKNILEIANNLIDATKSGSLEWEYMEDAPCLTACFDGGNYIICKTETDDNIHVISLNNLTETGELIGDFNKWNEGDMHYNEMDKLYSLAITKQVLKVC